MKFVLESHHRDVADDVLIQDVSRVAADLNAPTVTIDQYNENGRFHASTLTRRFGSWFKILALAGLKKTRSSLNISSEDLFENLSDLWLALGRQPKYDDLSSGTSRYSAGTYANRFGSWRKSLEAFVSWANEEEAPAAVASEASNVPTRRTPRTANWRLRALVLMRDGATCRLCGARPEHGVRLQLDHILPWAKGGETVLENLQILCEKCNVGKSDVNVGPPG